MAGARSEELLDLALRCLKSSGYDSSYPHDGEIYGRNVRVLVKNGESHRALIQTRSHEDKPRYLVGIMIHDLEKVDRVVLWLEGEDYFFIIPAQMLRRVLDKSRRIGDAAYSSRGKQWRVTIEVDNLTLSPQRKGKRSRIAGREHRIQEFACEVPEQFRRR